MKYLKLIPQNLVVMVLIRTSSDSLIIPKYGKEMF